MNYLFYTEGCGRYIEHCVVADTYTKARNLMEELFNNPKYLGTITDEASRKYNRHFVK